MIGKVVNILLSQFFSQVLATRSNAFDVQKNVLSSLVHRYGHCPLYQNISLKQEEFQGLLSWSSQDIKQCLARYELCDYQNSLLPLVQKGSGITRDCADLSIKTSGTSDANQGGKLIPAQWDSFRNDKKGIQRTLSCYLRENPSSSLFFTKAFGLSAPFDTVSCVGYVSGAMRSASSFSSSFFLLPSNKILRISDWVKKKQAIVQEITSLKPSLGSFHGVPTWPLEIIDELISQDRMIAKKVLSCCEYVSLGGGPALEYKQQFQDKIHSLGLSQTIAGSNNHNASEGFLGSQVRNFFDLSYHWMSPVMQTNFFLFVPVSLFDRYKQGELACSAMIMKSHLLHEVEYGVEYLMLFANDRIPWLYNIKDKVMFQKNDELPDQDSILEYIVTGRYGMASNVFNEHLELEHLNYAMSKIIAEGYDVDGYAFVSGMELVDNCGIFHLIVESHSLLDRKLLGDKIDLYLGEVNDQRKLFRSRGKIKSIQVAILPLGHIRKKLIALGEIHEQSKIPHLSDNNYKQIVKRILEFL